MMKRYDLYDDGEMIGDAEGVWVRYDDVAAALAATSAPVVPSALCEEHEPSLLTLASDRQSMSQISGADLRAFVNDVLGAITFIRPLQQSATSAPVEPKGSLVGHIPRPEFTDKAFTHGIATSAPSEPVAYARIEGGVMLALWTPEQWARKPADADVSGVQPLYTASQPAPAVPQPEALAEPALTPCNCRWQGNKLVQQCTLHEAHRDAIHDWAERAKAAERKLEALATTPAEVEERRELSKIKAAICTIDATCQSAIGLPVTEIEDRLVRISELCLAALAKSKEKAS